jgi:hypothetical protein
MDDPILMHQFTHQGFDVRIYLARAAEDLFGGHVDIFDGETRRCRIVLAGRATDDASAISALEFKGRDWIAAWASRDHSGNTGFEAL